ncbi:MAG TPA: methyltransferase domain-containing protein [Nocardioides sp.]|uniref:methyltransferase domain-containing protein n=1 Tax=Nocardioides sp. TaxID=35761 RepID=UPI002D800118|nr:methyltransferase domain-containing protein [Nocardioides sp.]HET6653575.1 methyltransferase domain-containing protein [Nocardioides sp.]
MPDQHSATSLQRRSAARTAVVWDALRGALADAAGADGVARVVDIGGGTGGLAVRAAELGHRVTVVDPSPDALAILARRAEESGVADLVTAHQGDLGTLGDLVPGGGVDVVLCHGVLEIVDDVPAALAAIAGVLRPGGVLSLLVNQRHAAVITRAMAGHFGQARAILDHEPDPAGSGQPGGTGRRFTAEEVTAVLDAAGFDTRAMHAVRVFVDLVPSSLVDLEPGAAERLVELEQAVAERPEYLPLGTQVHTLAARRAG